MPEIVTDGTTPQMPLPAAEETYGRQTNPGLGRFVLGTLQDAGTAFLGRAAERGTVAGSSSFDQGMAALTATGGAFDQPLVSVPQPAPSPEMPPEQYNDLYAPRDTNGKVVPIGDKPMPEALAKIIGRQKAEAMQRESVLARYAETHSGITTFAVGSLASMLDPLNAGAAFLPAIGEGAVAARLGGGLLARTAARVAAGAEMGIAQQLPLSAIKFGLSPEEASDYGLRDAMRDLAYGAAGVAVLHTGIGSIGEALGRARAREAAPAAEVAGGAEAPAPAPAEAAAILSADAVTKNAAMRGALGEISDGRPIDVAPIIRGYGPEAAPALARIDELTADRLAAERGERAAGSPAQSFSAIAAAEPAVEHSPADFLKLDPTISAADYTRRLSELRDNKPRPINKLWKNPDAAPPEEVAAAKERLKIWNSEYNKVSRVAKLALERDNEAFRAQQEARATPTATASQAELARKGWAPSVARDELVAANDAVYGVKPEAEAAPRPEAGSDAELTAAEERAAQIPPESLHPEDRAALAASAQEVEKAGFMQKALETAASCIMGII